MYIFPPISENFVYFKSIGEKIYKIAKKGRQFFACGSHTLIIINFSWEKIEIKKWGGGGKNMNLNFNINP